MECDRSVLVVALSLAKGEEGENMQRQIDLTLITPEDFIHPACQGSPRLGLSITAIQTFCRCPREWFLSRILRLVPIDLGWPRRFGRAAHEVWAEWDRSIVAGDDVATSARKVDAAIERQWPEADEDAAYRQRRNLLYVIARTWATNGKRMPRVAVDIPFRVPLRNPDSGRISRTFDLIGILDLVVRDPDRGRLWPWEYKFKSALDSRYIDSLGFDWQGRFYTSALFPELGLPVGGFGFHLLRYRMIGQEVGESWGEFQTRKEGMKRPGAAKRRVPESDEAYRERLIAMYSEKPEEHFATVWIKWDETDLAGIMRDVWRIAEEIRDLIANLKIKERASLLDIPHVPCRPACTGRGYGSNCDYLPYCRSGGSQALLETQYERQEATRRW